MYTIIYLRCILSIIIIILMHILEIFFLKMIFISKFTFTIHDYVSELYLLDRCENIYNDGI